MNQTNLFNQTSIKGIIIKVAEINKVCVYEGFDAENPSVRLFKNTFEDCTKDVATFIGAIHGLMLRKKKNIYGDVYIEDETVKKYIDNKKFYHNLSLSDHNIKAFEAIRRSEFWLGEQSPSNSTVELLAQEKSYMLPPH